MTLNLPCLAPNLHESRPSSWIGIYFELGQHRLPQGLSSVIRLQPLLVKGHHQLSGRVIGGLATATPPPAARLRP